jgi:hypothetical protein
VDENILGATFRCDEAKAFGGIEEFYGPDCHCGFLANDRPDECQEGENIDSGSVWARRARAGRDWRFFWSSRAQAMRS